MARTRRPIGEERDRVEDRRRQILAAAADVFARRGYHGARTREIAAEAGVSEGTIFNYYANKREILLALIQRVMTGSLPESLADIDTNDLRRWFAAVLRNRLEMFDRNRALLQAVAPEIIADETLRQEYLDKAVLPFVTEFLPRAQKAFEAAQLRSFNPGVVVPAVMGAVVAAFAFRLWEESLGMDTDRRQELIDELIDLFLKGLLTRKGDDSEARAPPPD